MCAANIVPNNWIDGIANFYEKYPNRGLASDLSFPSFPWIAPKCPKAFVDLVASLGETRDLEEGEYLYTQVPKIDKMCVVVKGLTARSLVAATGIEAQGVGISPPMHIACGNLNFFSQRLCCGCYYALSPATIVECPTKILREKAEKDTKLMKFMGAQVEMCSLADRFAFASMVLGSTERLKAFLCSWAANFGYLMHDRPGWIGLRFLPPASLTGKVISINWLLVKRIVKQWQNKGLWEGQGDERYFPADLIEPAYRWIIREEFEKTDIKYPKSISELLAKQEAGTK